MIGIVAGGDRAGLGVLATLPLLARVRARLDRDAVTALPFITAAARRRSPRCCRSLAPPFGVILLLALLGCCSPAAAASSRSTPACGSSGDAAANLTP